MGENRAQTRRKDKKTAFQVLYGFTFTSPNDLETLKKAYFFSLNNKELQPDSMDMEPAGYAWELIHGVWKHEGAINGLLEDCSHNWSLRRMGKIEQTILRLAIYELMAKQRSSKTVVREAMELADAFGVEKARNFISGILETAAKKISET